MHILAINTSIVISLIIKGKEDDLCYQDGVFLCVLLDTYPQKSFTEANCVH